MNSNWTWKSARFTSASSSLKPKNATQASAKTAASTSSAWRLFAGTGRKLPKKCKSTCLEIILKEQSPKKAIDYVHTIIADLKHRKVPLHDLIIWKTLTKPPEDYAIKAPHVEAAKMLKEKGWRLTGGDKVGYVILVGKGRLYSRVKPYVFAKYEEVDVDYYITNQVLPAAARILALLRRNRGRTA